MNIKEKDEEWKAKKTGHDSLVMYCEEKHYSILKGVSRSNSLRSHVFSLIHSLPS